MHLKTLSRAQAAGVHLACSTVLAGLIAWLVFGVWYPWPYNRLSGGAALFTLLVVVDVVLGPVLTLVVFNTKKPHRELRRDLSIIVLLQLAAMAYGLHAMAVARPAVLALEVDRFRTVPAMSVLESELARAPEQLRSISWTGPRIVSTRAPDAGEKADAIMLALSGVDLGMRPSFWLPWDGNARAAAKAAARPAAELASHGAEQARVLAQAAAEIGRPLEQLGYIPILARATAAIALVDRSSGEVLGYALVDGF